MSKPKVADRETVVRSTQVRTKLKGDGSWCKTAKDTEDEAQEEKPWLAEVRARRLNGAPVDTSPATSPVKSTPPSIAAKPDTLRAPATGYRTRGVFAQPDKSVTSSPPNGVSQTTQLSKKPSDGYKRIAPHTVRPTSENQGDQLSAEEQEKRTEAASNVLKKSSARQRSYVLSAAKKFESQPPDTTVVNNTVSFVATRVDITDEDEKPVSTVQPSPVVPAATSVAAVPEPSPWKTVNTSVKTVVDVSVNEPVKPKVSTVTPVQVNEAPPPATVSNKDLFEDMKPGCTKVATPLPELITECIQAASSKPESEVSDISTQADKLPTDRNIVPSKLRQWPPPKPTPDDSDDSEPPAPVLRPAVIPAAASPPPVAPAPVALTPKSPTPAAPTPVAPAPVARTPMSPTPVAPAPVARTPMSPTPVAPAPVARTPMSPTPVAPAPVAHTPMSPTPVAPAPVAHTPMSPTPISPTPVAPAPLSPTPVASTPMSHTPLSPTPVARAPMSPTPLSPTPMSPTPMSPTPVAPTPVSRTPMSPTPLSPTPVAPTPMSPTPLSPTPVARAPMSPTPLSPTPVAPTPMSPTPLSPTPVAPTPMSPTPLSPTPVARAPMSPTPLSPTPVARAPMSPTPLSPTPMSPTPMSPTPVAPTPVSRTPMSPTPLSPTPVAPTPMSPTPLSPTPVARAPMSPTPLSPTPVAPTPMSPTPLSPTPVAPTPMSPTPLSPTPVARAPMSPTPLSPTPVARAPMSPTPLSPTPVAPTRMSPTRMSPTPLSPTPVARAPMSPTPLSPTPVARTPLSTTTAITVNTESKYEPKPAPEWKPSPKPSSSGDTLAALSDTLISFDTKSSSVRNDESALSKEVGSKDTTEDRAEEDDDEDSDDAEEDYKYEDKDADRATSDDDSVNGKCEGLSDDSDLDSSGLEEEKEEPAVPAPTSPGRWSQELLSDLRSESTPQKTSGRLDLLPDKMIVIDSEALSLSMRREDEKQTDETAEETQSKEDNADVWSSRVRTTVTEWSSADPFDPYPIGTTSPNSSSDLLQPLSSISINRESSTEYRKPSRMSGNALESLADDIIPTDTGTTRISTHRSWTSTLDTSTPLQASAGESQEEEGQVENSQTMIKFERKSSENDSPWDRWTSPTVYNFTSATEEDEQGDDKSLGESHTVTTITTIREMHSEPEPVMDRYERHSRTVIRDEPRAPTPEPETKKGFVYVKEYVNATEMSTLNSRDGLDSGSDYLTSSSLNYAYSSPSYSRAPLSSACTYCGQQVGDDSKITIDHLGINCHPTCFKCGVCSKPMGDLLHSMFLHGGKVHCESCYSKV